MSKVTTQIVKRVIIGTVLIVVVFAVSSLLRLVFRKLMKKSNRAKSKYE